VNQLAHVSTAVDGLFSSVEPKPASTQAGREAPVAEEPLVEKPGTEGHGIEEPVAREPGTGEPGDGEPGTREPGTEEPAVELPGVKHPALSEDDEGSSGDEESAAGELRTACIEVEDSIRRLHAISARVRRAGPSYREAKAKRFKDKITLEAPKDIAAIVAGAAQSQEDVTFDRTELFSSMITARINYMFPDAEEWLRDRLASAISLRRNYLAYLDKMAHTHGIEADDDDGVSSDTSSVQGSVSSEPQIDADTLGAEPFNVDFADNVSFVARTEASTLSFQAGKILEIPEPKDVYQEVFVCPYCQVTCDANDATGKRWR
jgi:hypothetical protein